MADESLFGPSEDEQTPPIPFGSEAAEANATTGDTVRLDAADSPLFDPPPADPVLPPEPEMIDYSVVYAGRTFEIGEPDLATVCAIANTIGDIMLTAERHLAIRLQGLFNETIAGKAQSSQPFEATLFGLLAVLQPRHILRIGAIVLFGGKESQKQEADAFFKNLPEDQLRIAPIIKALALRIRRSEDLAEALGNFRLAQGAVGVWAARTTRQPSPATPSS